MKSDKEIVFIGINKDSNNFPIVCVTKFDELESKTGNIPINPKPSKKPDIIEMTNIKYIFLPRYS